VRENLDRYFWQNVVGVSVGEFLWGLGLPVVIESTFITVFLTYLGVSNSEIGFVEMLSSIAFATVPFFSAYFTSKLPYKKMSVILVQILPSLSIICLGFYYIVFGSSVAGYQTFVVFYSLFSIGLAATGPVWLNYIVKIFSPERCVKGISMIMIAQNTGKLLSSFFLTLTLFHFKINSYTGGLIFFLTGTSFLLGSLCLFFTKESRDKIDSSIKESINGYFLKYFKEIIRNRNLLLFLLQDIEFVVVIVTITFYPRYAIYWCSIPASETGGSFIVFLFAGAIVANLVLGFMNGIRLKIRYALIKFTTLVSLLLLILFKEKVGFYTISFLLGFSRSGRIHLYGPLIKKLSGLEDATPYYALLPFLMLPVSGGLPIVAGFLLDGLSELEGMAYSILFSLLLIIAFLTIFPFLELELPEETIK